MGRVTTKILVLLAVLLLAASLAGGIAGCGSSTPATPDQGQTGNGAQTGNGGQTGDQTGGGQTGGGTSVPQTVNVSMESISFVPQTVTIKVGDTIVWTNNESAPHDVVFADFQSEVVNRNGTIARTFTTPGTFTYFCSIHGETRMNGTVIVTP